GMIAAATVLATLQIWVVDEKRYGTGRSSTVALGPALKMAFKNRGFVLFALTNQVYFWSDNLFTSGMIYFITIICGLSDSMMLAFGGTIAGLGLLLYPLVNVAAARTGKKFLYSLALVMMTLLMPVFAFADKIPIPISTLSWIMVGLVAIPCSITGIIPGAISTEIVREDCLRTGVAKEASFGAANGLICAIPGGFVGLIMPSLLLLGKSQANPTGVRAIALASAACSIAALVMLRLLFDEKKLQASLAAHGYR
ncbi:MAG: MFS transporter, partial [Spirochaetaceae bacterium]|nr:MFS transporter [Spirochaetaceae bacterium]